MYKTAKFSFLRSVLLCVLGLMIMLSFPLLKSVEAYVASGYYRSSNSVSFYLNSAFVTLGWQGAFNNARNSWNSAGSAFSFYQIGTTGRFPSLLYSGTTDGYNDIGGMSLGMSYVALTESQTSGWQIIETDTAYNTNHPFSTSPSSLYFDVESVAAHELGHWLHLDETQSWRCVINKPTMCPSLAKGNTDLRSLETDDINGINYIY